MEHPDIINYIPNIQNKIMFSITRNVMSEIIYRKSNKSVNCESYHRFFVKTPNKAALVTNPDCLQTGFPFLNTISVGTL